MLPPPRKLRLVRKPQVMAKWLQQVVANVEIGVLRPDRWNSEQIELQISQRMPAKANLRWQRQSLELVVPPKLKWRTKPRGVVGPQKDAAERKRAAKTRDVSPSLPPLGWLH